MAFDLTSVARNSEKVESDEFVALLESAISLLRSEDGRIGHFVVDRKLVKLDPLGEALVIGDLHGDLGSLQLILRDSNIVSRLDEAKDSSVVFLGDYGDRGAHSAEVYYVILKLKLAYPKQVILLRGNHEGPEDLLASPHNLPLQLKFKFKEKWGQAYSTIRKLFDGFYNAVVVKDRYLMLHGGLSPLMMSFQDLALARQQLNSNGFLEDLLWNDPEESLTDLMPSPRGAGRLFGKNVTKTVLDNFKVQVLIRGHEAAEEGFRIDHEGRILTLFSRKGPPYFNRCGAYLDLPLSKQFTSANQLVPWIHKF